MPDTQQTFIMVKPDGVRRRLIGEVVARIEANVYVLKEMKLFTIDETLAKKHYAEHVERPFFGELVSFITSGPVVAMVWEGPEAVKLTRQMIGATKPLEATPGTIRGDYTSDVLSNLIHGSDSPENAAAEIALWFKAEELL